MRQPARLAASAIVLAATTLLAACAASVSLDEPIEGRDWRLTRVGTQPVALGGDPQRDAQVRFDGARVSGFSGCNQLTGDYERSGNRLKIGPLAATRMACTDPTRNAMESSFVGALQGTASYSLLGRQLSLNDSAGRTLAVLDSGR
ncbi:META domain-containing protein [Variovorax ginsengisoli]|uniref:Lipoprotein n=1 Tax=Variovorax ginsengisoli TaxID=363844 RepID=A0ABT9S8V6_9BURK|nr:META domain-containing protein [Variovorax ginsengisoli]MDP9900288.1 putative lipoprotein [Variovorax ginsengisoli]